MRVKNAMKRFMNEIEEHLEEELENERKKGSEEQKNERYREPHQLKTVLNQECKPQWHESRAEWSPMHAPDQ